MIRRRLLAARPVQAGGRELVPLARAWELRLGGGRAGAVWLRPAGVEVCEADGGRHLIEVRDPTRWYQAALLAAGAVAFVVLQRRARAKGAMR